MNSSWYDLLLRSFDTPLTQTEQQQLRAALQTSEELRSLQEEFLKTRSTLSTFSEQAFADGFTSNVMRRIAARQQSIQIRFETVFRPIAVAALLLVAVLCTINAANAKEVTVNSLLGIQHPTLEQTLRLEAALE